MRRLDPVDRFALAACVLLGLAARVAALGRDDLSAGEVAALADVSGPLGDLVAGRAHAGPFALESLVLRAWTAVAGTSQFALRLPSAVAGAALLAPAFGILRRLVPATAARWGLAILAVHPVFVGVAREAGSGGLLALLFVALAHAAVVAVADAPGAGPGRRVPVTLWAAAALGPLSGPAWSFAAAPVALWAAFEARRDGGASGPRAARVVVAGIVGSVALHTALTFAAPHPTSGGLAVAPALREIAALVARPFVGGDLRWAGLAAVGVTAIGWSVCVARGFFEGDARGRRFAAWIGLGLPAGVLAADAVGTGPRGGTVAWDLAALGWTVVAALSAEHSARVRDAMRGEIERMRAEGGVSGFGLLRWSVTRDPVGVPWLVASLALLAVTRLRVQHTEWSDAAAEIRAAGGAAPVVVVTDDAGSRDVLAHYLAAGEADEPGAPADAGPGVRWTVTHEAAPTGTPYVRAHLDVSGERPVVRIDRVER